jgi:conserved hypothetical protein
MKFSPFLIAVVFKATASIAFVLPSHLSNFGQFHQKKLSPSAAPQTSLNLISIFKKDSSGTMSNMKERIDIPPPHSISEGQVRSLFYLWNNALATGDPRIVAKRYAADAVLLPTVSDIPRKDKTSISSYFTDFLKLKPQGIVIDGNIKIGKDWASDTGIYEFTMGADGSKVMARYTFIYTFEDGQWKILHHHSSKMPDGHENKMGSKMTDDQVRNLFFLWNDALDTQDPDIVAKRYAKNAVLLPTVSDKPRTDYESIKDYFETFCKLKPQGKILESHVLVGNGWCKDVGIYEFTMGANGSKVKARYSFVYIFEDGQWKISHQHSSTMPEEKNGPNLTPQDVKSLFSLWNDALATLNSDKVAKRYAKDAVLLPTVSDIPRTDYKSIKNYFDSFLQKKPQGVILESFPSVGKGWCKDVGIYEFTMGADGSKVKARYTFVYVFEDGEWKISHHHSSIMPESHLVNGDKSASSLDASDKKVKVPA